MKKLITLICILLCAASVLVSCKKTQPHKSAKPGPEKITTVLIDRTMPPASVESRTSAFAGVSAVYPKIKNTNTDGLINERIEKRHLDFASEYGTLISNITYDIKYNDHGVLSILFSAKSNETSVMLYLPVNFNTAGGEEITLSSLFNKKDTAWRDAAALYINTQAKLRNLETHSEFTLERDKSFYLTDTALVIIYEMYEVTYASAGSPAFGIPYGVLKDHISDNGAIDVILSYQN